LSTVANIFEGSNILVLCRIRLEARNRFACAYFLVVGTEVLQWVNPSLMSYAEYLKRFIVLEVNYK